MTNATLNITVPLLDVAMRNEAKAIERAKKAEQLAQIYLDAYKMKHGDRTALFIRQKRAIEQIKEYCYTYSEKVDVRPIFEDILRIIEDELNEST